MYGNVCFENEMDNVTVEDNCDCPMECNSISYSFNLVSTPFDPQLMCPSPKSTDDFLLKDFYDNKFPPKYVRKLIEFKDNVSSQDRDYCTRNIQFRADVVFRLATNSMPVTVISRRLSFFDKMSSFGES